MCIKNYRSYKSNALLAILLLHAYHRRVYVQVVKGLSSELEGPVPSPEIETNCFPVHQVVLIGTSWLYLGVRNCALMPGKQSSGEHLIKAVWECMQS